MPTWDVTLPQLFLVEGYQDGEPNYVLKTEMDVGPPKMRLRYKAQIRIFSGNMLMTLAQKATLASFYADYCASAFDFPNQDDGGVTTISTVFQEPPSYQPAGGTYWKVALKLAEVPS